MRTVQSTMANIRREKLKAKRCGIPAEIVDKCNSFSELREVVLNGSINRLNPED